MPCACVNNFKEVFDDPHIVARGVVKDVEHPRLGAMRAARNPVLFDHDGPTLERIRPCSANIGGNAARARLFPAEIRGLVATGVTRVAAHQHSIRRARA